MKEKLLLGIFFILFSGIAAGCGNGGGSGNSSEDAVELEMYSWRTEDRSAYEEIIAAFEEENPDIKIKFNPFEATEYNTILTNALVSGTGPDIVQLRPYTGARTIADNGYLVALDDIEGLDNFDETYLEAAQGSDGNTYGIPLSLNIGLIYYNIDIFNEYGLEPPETWDDFIAVSQELKNNGVTPLSVGGREAWLLSMLHGVITPTAYGGNDFVEDITEGEADLTDPRMMESLDRMEELTEYIADDFMALDDADSTALFYTEEAAMYVNGDFQLEVLENSNPDLSIGVIPGFKEEGSDDPLVMNWVDGSYGVVEGTEHEEEALKFMEFMASPEFGQLFTDNLTRVSAVEGVTASHDIVKQIMEASEANSTPYLMLVEYGLGSPSTKGIFEDGLQGMYLGEITKEELLEQSQENAERAAEEGVEELEMIEEDE
ncbi:ABC transporter substrate-binding protein [Oceanobacillus sojae]|uniref:ABC transporter substrate-binding protein n=1 Tax=Oceanobacillus sojae TaxID=582851 RepID=UPI00098830F0|nr:extracellular solute-binding protein [Oceanobacillus sojae]MCT1902403.1 extracellular solute-binding protein [Oceanobacillus sojae]